ncbi:hypothetical protein [Azospirillum thiophilum]|nr:hypothetical protein [Azospirillum thiophilum]
MTVESSIEAIEDGWRWTVIAGDRRVSGVAGTPERAAEAAAATAFFEETAPKLAALYPKG